MFATFSRKLPAVFAVLVAATVFVGRPASAQGAADPVIVLDNVTPSVDVVVTPNNGASGVVYVEMADVHLTLKDSANADVLTLVDKRVTAIALQLAQGAATHTLHLERLPGVDQARARVTAQATLPIVDSAPAGNKADDRLAAFVAPTISQISLAPAQTMPVTTTDKADLVSLQLPAQEATVQLVDDKGSVLLTTIAGKKISGLSMRLTPGQYALNLANRDVNSTSNVTMTVSPAPESNLPDAAPSPAAQPSAQGNTATNLGVACTASVNVASMNLRSGPGTGYTVLGSVNQSNTLPVGGVSKEGGWLLVKGPNGSAWIAQSSASLSGNCKSLPAFNIPVRNAVAPVVVQQGNAGGGQPAVGGQGQQGDDHRGEPQGGDQGGNKGQENDD